MEIIAPIKHLTVTMALVFGVIGIFYVPTFFLLPDDPTVRWAVWMLGYICGIVIPGIVRHRQ